MLLNGHVLVNIRNSVLDNVYTLRLHFTIAVCSLLFRQLDLQRPSQRTAAEYRDESYSIRSEADWVRHPCPLTDRYDCFV